AVALAHDVMKQDVGRAWHARRDHDTDDRVGGQSHFQLFRFEPTVEDKPGGSGKNVDGFDTVLAEYAKAEADLRQSPEVANAPRPWVWRCFFQERFQKVCHA